jgi:hypothetical protein
MDATAPATDHVDPAAFNGDATDQRGFPRSDSAPDAGAFETCNAPTVTSSEEMKSALECYNTNGLGTTTHVDLGANIFLESELPAIDNPTGSLIVEGNGHLLGSNTFNPLGFRVLHIQSGFVSLNEATVAFGSDFDGGGIRLSGGELRLTNSTVSDNRAQGKGGGVYVASGRLSLSNSTISGNEAFSGGGLYNESGTLDVGFSTVTDNKAWSASGSGVGSGNGAVSTTLTASIVASNVNGTDVAATSSGGILALTSGGYNVLGAVAVQPASPVFAPATGDVLGAVAGVDALADNGGPTQTHALLSTSAAVDRVTASVAGDPLRDQRGISRPQGDARDTGPTSRDPVRRQCSRSTAMTSTSPPASSMTRSTVSTWPIPARSRSTSP